MTRQIATDKLEYETTELKLSALILSEVPDCLFEICDQGNSTRKIIKIKYPACYKTQISVLEKDFINKRALTNVYLYNKALNQIRDRLRENVNGKQQHI